MVAGHSTGRYAGSAWYADTFWRDIDSNMIANINVDSPGVKGAEDFSVRSTAETRANVVRIVKEITGKGPETKWWTCKMGDQSFWNIGVPSISIHASVPRRSDVWGSAGAWWWHTEYDTIDKVDKDILALDTKIVGAIALELVNAPLLPFDLEQSFAEIVAALDELQSQHRIDLSELIAASRILLERSAKLKQLTSHVEASSTEMDQAKNINSGMMTIVMLVNSIYYTRYGRHEQDPAIKAISLPSLRESIQQQIKCRKNSDEYRFLDIQMNREKNKILEVLLYCSNVMDNLIEHAQHH